MVSAATSYEHQVAVSIRRMIAECVDDCLARRVGQCEQCGQSFIRKRRDKRPCDDSRCAAARQHEYWERWAKENR